jgi:hypothetical protein
MWPSLGDSVWLTQMGTSTAGRRSERVKTERTEVSISDFQKEMERLEAGSESINGLIYGDSNCGKTRLAGTAPGKVFWLVGENGAKSAGRAGAKGYMRRISDTATALAAIDWLNYKERYRQLDWIILDGATTMQDRFRMGYAAEAFDIDSAKRQHRNLPDRPDYFNTQNFLKSWIPMLVDMPVNLLITAHAYRTDETENGELLTFPGFQGKVTETANAISGLMDFTGYMEYRNLKLRDGSVKPVRRLWFSSPEARSRKEDSIRYICGDKFNGVLGKYMDAPTIPKMLAKINGVEE